MEAINHPLVAPFVCSEDAHKTCKLETSLDITTEVEAELVMHPWDLEQHPQCQYL